MADRGNAEERMSSDFLNLMGVASQLAETWINGNRTDVYLAIESAAYRDAPALALMVSSYFDVGALRRPDSFTVELARALHSRGFTP